MAKIELKNINGEKVKDITLNDSIFKIEVNDEKSLKNAVKNDYVCATYKGNSRSDDNFIMADCLPVDCDNDTTDDPSKWLTVDKLKAIFPDVSFAIHYSRNHMKDKIYKDKNGEVSKVVKARPRFHVFFEIDELSDKDAYRNFKNYLSINYPYFDNMIYLILNLPFFLMDLLYIQ